MTQRPSKLTHDALHFILACALLTSSACDEATQEEQAEQPSCQGDTCVQASQGLRMTYLDVQHDLANPVYVNNRVPVEYGITGYAEGEPTQRQAALTFSFVESEPADPEAPISCSSSAHLVEVTTDGKEQRFKGFIWPTTLCGELVGKKVSLAVEFDGGEDENAQTDSPSVVFNPANRAAKLNALCRDAKGQAGCVYDLNIEPTPQGAQGKLIDVLHASMNTASAVALLPAKESEPMLSVDSVLVVNGRDPYISAMAPDEIPQDLLKEDPALAEDLLFGLSPDQVDQLITLPGKATLRYELRPAGSSDAYMQLQVALEAGAKAETAPVNKLNPGSPNTFTHELFAMGQTREALTPGGAWGAESDFEVRGCFGADFEQASDAAAAGSDCQVLDVVLVRETKSANAALSLEMSKRFDRSVGGDRLNLASVLETENRLDTSGASSRIEGSVTINGDIGREFSFDVARALAQASAGFDPAANGYEVSVVAFGQAIYEISEVGGEIVKEEEFSAAKDFKLPDLGFGFGPVRLGLAFTVGGEVGISVVDALTTTTNTETCAEYLGEESAAIACGQIGRTTTPFFAFTGLIEGGVQIGPVSGGVEAELRMINTEFPLGATLSFGMDEQGAVSVLGNALWDLELTLIQGDVSIVGRIRFRPRIMRRFNRTLRVHLFSFSSPLIQTNLLDEDLALEILQ